MKITNPLGIESNNTNKIPFHIYFRLKDLFGFSIFIILFLSINLEYPYLFRDPTNFIVASSIFTPLHIRSNRCIRPCTLHIIDV